MRKLGPVVFSFLGGVAGAVAFLGLVAAKPTPPKGTGESGTFKSLRVDAITARRIDVVGDDGQVTITTAPHAGARISLHSKDSEANVHMGATGSGAYVSVGGSSLISQTANLSFNDGRVTVNVTDAAGQTRVVVGQTSLVTKASGVKEDTPVGSITVFDEVGNVVWRSPR